MMNNLSLDGSWELQPHRAAPAAGMRVPRSVPARVPGDVMTDLLRERCIPDPFVGENEREVQWVGECGWTYKRAFMVPASLLREERVLLQCDGLDTLATVEINGTIVARTDNMHRSYEWDVKPLLRARLNTIRVTFEPVNPATRDRFRERSFRARINEGHRAAYPGLVRKMACNFGWDWGPILVTCGIWRGIRLVGWSTARVGDVRIEQVHTHGAVTLGVACRVERAAGCQPEGACPALNLKVVLSLDGSVVAETEAPVQGDDVRVSLPVPKPKLWWPNGMGEQPLYDVRVELREPTRQRRGGTAACETVVTKPARRSRVGTPATAVADTPRILDLWSKHIGLRTLRLDRHADAWGESFQFVANGVPFFAKGANWIPVDALMGRRTPADYRRLVEDAAAANMNMLRVWGGGVYEDDVFYERCDELGLCVWQDFMFACIAYPTWDKAFMETVKAEARDNVRRLRHHACIALWCGNNEMEQQAVGEKPNKAGETLLTWDEYRALFDCLLADVVCELAPETDYWPSSPHSPQGDRADYNNPACGDAHLWDVWHGRAPFESFRECPHRFNSEFGFQSFPEPRTVQGYAGPRDRSINSAVMEHHQRSGIGNSTILQYLLDWFRLPTSFDMNLWASQILQGMAIKYAVEHWRRSMPRGMGTLYWQINDVWPVASWASIDYHGRWKALHHMARRFFAPVIVSGVEDANKGTVEVHVTSDRLETRSGVLQWIVTDAAGKTLRSGVQNVRSPVNGSRRIATLRLADVLKEKSARDLMVWLELAVEGEPLSTNWVSFGRPKHLAISEDPGICAEVEKTDSGAFCVGLTARRVALWVWIELEGADARVSDNFVHLRPGCTVRLTVVPEKPLTLARFLKLLRVRSLVDTYRDEGHRTHEV